VLDQGRIEASEALVVPLLSEDFRLEPVQGGLIAWLEGSWAGPTASSGATAKYRFGWRRTWPRRGSRGSPARRSGMARLRSPRSAQAAWATSLRPPRLDTVAAPPHNRRRKLVQRPRSSRIPAIAVRPPAGREPL